MVSPNLSSVSFPVSSSSLPVGARLHNRYEVRGYIGGGANGTVYEVYDHKQQHIAALKMLDPAREPPGGWYVEAEFLTRLRGDYILPILNADEEAGVPFLVTEVMANRSTEAHITPGVGVPVNRAATWVQQACAGVSRILDLRALHRDIKPANLFLDRDLNVLVGDFGLACPMDASGGGTPAGSPETMAPEIAQGQPTGPRSEVYSLGASLYQLIAGHWLNPDVHAMHLARARAGDIYAAVASHTPTSIGDVAPHVTQGLRAVIMRAVAPDPADRYATPAALAAAIGGRTIPRRAWTRTAPCAGHVTCFIGIRAGFNDYQLCAVPTGTRGRLELQSRHVQSGRKIGPWPVVTPARLTATIRARIAAMT